jgi:hypothetical protein
MNPGSKNATIGIDESLIDMEGFEGGFLTELTKFTEPEQSTFNATKHENAGKIRQLKIFIKE